MIKTCSLAASTIITMALVLGFSAPVSAAQPGAAAAATAVSVQLPPLAAGCCVLA